MAKVYERNIFLFSIRSGAVQYREVDNRRESSFTPAIGQAYDAKCTCICMMQSHSHIHTLVYYTAQKGTKLYLFCISSLHTLIDTMYLSLLTGRTIFAPRYVSLLVIIHRSNRSAITIGRCEVTIPASLPLQLGWWSRLHHRSLA